jgi:hypothetical protein
MNLKRTLVVLGLVVCTAAFGSAAFAQSTNLEAGGVFPEAVAPSGIQAYGDFDSDVVFVPLPPCRIIDTRVGGGIMTAGSTRSFRVTGSGFTAQGGVAGSCGVPVGGATAAFINFVAVNAQGAGDFRVTPFGTPIPTASFLNYATVTGLNIANGVAVDICNTPAACTSDFTVQADASDAHIVADVMGYWKPAPPAGRAWASVQRSPVVQFEAARTRNFTALNRPSTGVYCLTPAATLSLANTPIMVTVEWGNSLGFDLLAFPLGTAFNCPAGTLEVRTYQFPAGAAALSNNVSFFVWIP